MSQSRNDIDWFAVRRFGEDVMRGSEYRLHTLWSVLKHRVYFDHDLQCGNTPYIHLDGHSWYCWQRCPTKLHEFIQLTGRRFGLRLEVTERLDHSRGNAAAFVSVIRSSAVRATMCRGYATGRNMEETRFEALLKAFVIALITQSGT